MIFGIKEIENVDPYNVLFAIAINIPVLRMVLWSRVTLIIYLLVKHHMNPDMFLDRFYEIPFYIMLPSKKNIKVIPTLLTHAVIITLVV